MSDTGFPSVDFVIDQLPFAEGMLDAMGEPELALYLTALAAAVKVVEGVMMRKQFDAKSAIAAADAAAEAALRARFPK